MNTNAFQCIAGRPCLDFLNTANWSADGEIIEEKLNSDQDIALWCHAAGLATVTDQSGRLDELRTFRNVLRSLFMKVLTGTSLTADDLSPLNECLAAISGPALQAPPNGEPPLSATLALDQAIAVSAMAVLSHGAEIDRVKICPGHDCAWLFLDESKNRRRTWCSMETCGNRAKAKRHYQRKSKPST